MHIGLRTFWPRITFCACRGASSVQNRRGANTTVGRTLLNIFFLYRVWWHLMHYYHYSVEGVPSFPLVVKIWIDEIYRAGVALVWGSRREAPLHTCVVFSVPFERTVHWPPRPRRACGKPEGFSFLKVAGLPILFFKKFKLEYVYERYSCKIWN